MIILIISNIIYWIVYNISLKMFRRTIKSKLDSDPAYAEHFHADTMTFYENYQLALISAFFVFGPH